MVMAEACIPSRLVMALALAVDLQKTLMKNWEQILFARMGITSVLCLMYMLYHNIAPLGVKEIRWLLVVRGISGFVGVLGLYCE